MALTPDDVLTEARNSLPDGAVLTAAVAVLTYVVPGEDDEAERGPFLAWTADTSAGRWVHLGMIETVSNDFRGYLSADNRDRDD